MCKVCELYDFVCNTGEFASVCVWCVCTCEYVFHEWSLILLLSLSLFSITQPFLSIISLG